MSSSRIRTRFAKGEVVPNWWNDYHWIAKRRKELGETYGECVIVVYEQRVIGVGKTTQEAMEEAESSLAPDIEQITPAIYSLYLPHSIKRIVVQHPE